jgi:hypothetical protein
MMRSNLSGGGLQICHWVCGNSRLDKAGKWEGAESNQPQKEAAVSARRTTNTVT